MAKWYESSVKTGDPVDGEFDFVFDNTTGEMKIVKLVSGSWVVQGTVNPDGLVGAKGPDGDPCPTGGEADTLDGHHAAEFLPGAWHVVGASGEPAYHSDPAGMWANGTIRFRKIGDMVQIFGTVWHVGYPSSHPGGSILFTLPEGYRPSVAINWKPLLTYSYQLASMTITINTDGTVVHLGSDIGLWFLLEGYTFPTS